MKVLIIGGNRFVGYLLTWRLVASGHAVTLFNRGSIPDPFGSRLERLRGDRTTADFGRLLQGRQFDAAVDFAAFHGRDARSIMEVLPDVGHYILISTGQVYLVKTHSHWPAREDDYAGEVAPRPADPQDADDWLYGVGKREAENALIQAWNDHRFPATRLRIPMVNGERDYFRRMESYLWRILDAGPVLLPDGGSNLCRHVYGDDVAAAIAALLGRTDTFGKAYNLSQTEEIPLADLVALLADLAGAPDRRAAVPSTRLLERGLPVLEVSPFSGKWMSRLDPSRAIEEIGFRPTPLREYCGRILASFLAHPPAAPPAGYLHRAMELRLAGEIAPTG